MPKPIRAILAFVFALLLCFTGSFPISSSAAETKATWQAEWEKTVKAAEDEGALALYITGAFEPVFRESFQKKFPKIKVTTVTGRGPELSQRVMSERHAEKYAVDLYVSENISPLTVFHRAKILQPVQPLLLLPDVVDLSAWYEGKHHYDDPENRYNFVFEGTPRSGEITFNSKIVNPAEIKSYWDLLNVKWKRQDRLRRSVPVRSDQRGAHIFLQARRTRAGVCPAAVQRQRHHDPTLQRATFGLAERR